MISSGVGSVLITIVDQYISAAADIYWSTMVMSTLPTPEEIMPRTEQNQGMLMWFEGNSKIPAIKEVLSNRIQDHQHYILKNYCETPAILGGDLL